MHVGFLLVERVIGGRQRMLANRRRFSIASLLVVVAFVLGACGTPVPTAPRAETAEVPPPPMATSVPWGDLLGDMIPIPAGEFTMGSTQEEINYGLQRCEESHGHCQRSWFENELPQHTVYLNAFYIGRYEVTNAQYERFVRATGYQTPRGWSGGSIPGGLEDHPVVNVSWHDALAYCRWLSEETGQIVRLPTEAEWEKAARGTDGRVYPWGDEFDAAKCNSLENDIQTTTPVGQYSPQGDSPYGVADVAGNVWEWTSSVHKGYPYDPVDGREDLGAGGSRVLRGGAFYGNHGAGRCAARNRDPADLRDDAVGFRVAVPAGSP
jgi:formylglycine-generating enzyme required for sulfatase activity